MQGASKSAHTQNSPDMNCISIFRKRKKFHFWIDLFPTESNFHLKLEYSSNEIYNNFFQKKLVKVT